ncbi:MAG: hypothetical protein EU536_02750 [Promethearchaeota archaeon]|nr:MAG: hypothetical protein EU536_02750 [Candidatus Lokiarchaeota archaeon]
MTTITVEKEILMDLIDSKLRVLQDEIQAILIKWNYSAIEKFLSDARDRTLEEAEDDAICMRNLTDKREELFQLKYKWIIQT